jgi:hypothetical protein
MFGIGPLEIGLVILIVVVGLVVWTVKQFTGSKP